MHPKKRSVSLMLAALGTLALLLVACGGSHSTKNTPQTMLQQPSRATMLPMGVEIATTPGGQVYLGQVSGQKTWIGISTDGTNVVAFVTDGSPDHTATFAEWFKGTVKDKDVNLTAPTKNGNDSLTATLSSANATGSFTNTGGQPLQFSANLLPSETGTATPPASTTPGSGSSMVTAGIYKGTGTFNGDSYTAGWIVMPDKTTGDQPTPTPSTSATADPPTMLQAGGIVNTKTFEVTAAPDLTRQTVSSGDISVPNLGTFTITQCQAGSC